ncbi:hypothetical protein KSP40_PGU001100 [Platanthera guangdongensis]|uniref:Uncharacterized protein n=1 Tax=Platanthera guangdongensis TaxID=2320717 RepID=A0ABR2MGD2_9ASPA
MVHAPAGQANHQRLQHRLELLEGQPQIRVMASEGVRPATRFARRSRRNGHELGTANEAAVIERYRSMTGNYVSFQGFAVSAET